MSITRGIIGALVSATLVLGAVSCGGTGSNNDQGTSFLAYGYFNDSQGQTGSSGAIVALAPDSAVLVGTGGASVQLLVDGNAVLTFMGFQNRLANQFIRLVRIDCSYDIPGSNLQIPDDSFNSAAVISSDPAADDRDDETGQQVPLPTGEGSTLILQFEVVSPDIISYINVNRNSLPELPFRMNVSCRGVGVTQSGDTIVTNDLVYFVQFFDQAECCTGSDFETIGDTVVNDGSTADDGGFQGGSGSGGGVSFSDGTSTGSVGDATGGLTSSASTTTDG